MMESEVMEDDLASLDFAAVDDMVGQRFSITTTNPQSPRSRNTRRGQKNNPKMIFDG